MATPSMLSALMSVAPGKWSTTSSGAPQLAHSSSPILKCGMDIVW